MRRIPTERLLFTALCTALTVVSARISLPIPGLAVVFTAQVCVVLCCGLLLGPRFGALSQGLYLLLGLAGLPVFAQGGGPGYVAHPTFGYLLGFVAAASVSGWLAQRTPQPSFLRMLLAALAGAAMVYVVALPVVWLQAQVLSRGLPAFGAFLMAYCVGFLPMDAVKAVLAATLCQQILKRLPVVARAAG